MPGADAGASVDAQACTDTIRFHRMLTAWSRARHRVAGDHRRHSGGPAADNPESGWGGGRHLCDVNLNCRLGADCEALRTRRCRSRPASASGHRDTHDRFAIESIAIHRVLIRCRRGPPKPLFGVRPPMFFLSLPHAARWSSGTASTQKRCQRCASDGSSLIAAECGPAVSNTTGNCSLLLLNT